MRRAGHEQDSGGRLCREAADVRCDHQPLSPHPIRPHPSRQQHRDRRHLTRREYEPQITRRPGRLQHRKRQRQRRHLVTHRRHRPAQEQQPKIALLQRTNGKRKTHRRHTTRTRQSRKATVPSGDTTSQGVGAAASGAAVVLVEQLDGLIDRPSVGVAVRAWADVVQPQLHLAEVTGHRPHGWSRVGLWPRTASLRGARRRRDCAVGCGGCCASCSTGSRVGRATVVPPSRPLEEYDELRLRGHRHRPEIRRTLSAEPQPRPCSAFTLSR